MFAPHTARRLVRGLFPNGNPYGADYVVRTSLPNDRGSAAWLTVTLVSLSTREVLLKRHGLVFLDDQSEGLALPAGHVQALEANFAQIGYVPTHRQVESPVAMPMKVVSFTIR